MNSQLTFFMLALLRRASFSPPSMVYISVIIYTYTLQITFLHANCVEPRFYAVSMQFHSNLNLINNLFLLKISRPCGDLNPGPIW